MLNPSAERSHRIAVLPNWRPTRVLTIVWCGVVTFLLLYMTLSVRTMGYGATSIWRWPIAVGLLVLFAVPLLSPLLLTRLRPLPTLTTYLLTCLVVAAIAFFTSESIACLEEWAFRRSCSGLPDSAQAIFKNRWCPFQHHFLTYNPDTGEFSGGD